MKDRSTMGPIEYVFESVFWCLISMTWYKNILFRCIPNVTYAASKTVLWILLFASITACAVCVFRIKRTGWSVLVSLVLPYGIYTVVTYWRTLQSRILIVLAIAAVLSMVMGILVLTRNVRTRKNLKRIYAKRFRNWIAATGNIYTVAMIVIMAPLFFQGAFGVTLFKFGIEAKIGNENANQTISSNIDMVLKLQDEEWCSLSTNDKLDVLQCVANIEAYYLGLSNELNVGASNLPEYTLACYSDASHTIYINLEHLENDSVEEVLNSCCHEAYHGYQHRLVDAYNESSEENQRLRIYRNAVYYIEEFGDYAGGYEDFCSYYSQRCEMDARAYAEDAVVDYYSQIDEYLSGEVD